MASEVNRPSNPGIATPIVLDDRSPASGRRERQLQRALEQIETALNGLRFGQVTITVQDGVVVQIDRLERTRLQRNPEGQ